MKVGLLCGREYSFPPAFLDRWPSADQRTRIVLITKGVPPHFATRLLDAAGISKVFGAQGALPSAEWSSTA